MHYVRIIHIYTYTYTLCNYNTYNTYGFNCYLYKHVLKLQFYMEIINLETFQKTFQHGKLLCSNAGLPSPTLLTITAIFKV